MATDLTVVLDDRAGERLDVVLPGGVLVDPGRVALGLAQRLLDVGLEPHRLDRPASGAIVIAFSPLRRSRSMIGGVRSSSRSEAGLIE